MAAPAQWNALDFMIDFQMRRKQLDLLTETLAWGGSVALFREAETQTHYLNPPTSEDRRHHQTLLAALIAEGQRLLSRAVEAGGLPDNLDGLKTSDLDALIEELRTTQFQWEIDMTQHRREQILKELFDVPPR
jgi:hypothetical protein